MFALVDCNNFYASCQRVFQPQYNGKPIVVLSNNDGCVIARSNEAKALGIKMGAPAFKFEKEFADKGINVFSSNYALYGNMSSRVMTLLSEFAPEIEVYSVDEAFLDFSGFSYFDLQAIGERMRKVVYQGTGIPVCVGFAPTKALAKAANRIAKKFPQLGGVYLMDSPEKILKAMKWLKIEDVWGIGRQHAIRLQAQGVYNALDFTMMNSDWIKKNMSVIGLRLQKELSGIRTLELEDIAPKKSIACTRSFDHNYSTFDELKERVVTYATICAEKLRKQNSCCNVIQVFIHTNFFREDQPKYSKSITIDLPYPTNSNLELAKFAIEALKRIYKDGYSYKKAGVIVMELTPEIAKQTMLFENSEPRHLKLMEAVDKLNKSYGQQKVKLAAQDLSKTWKMKRERLSPKFTTDVKDIMIIFAK